MRPVLILLFIVTSFAAIAQNVTTHSPSKRFNPRKPVPKLVVGIVIDQMRWDYLYRYQSRFGNGGFKRMMNEGFSADNTFVPYVPTVTAAGHTCVYTGSVPNIHGIVGNNWFEASLNKMVYCTDDDTARTIGSTSKAGKMSPRNMYTNTVCDELRLSNNFRGKVIGIALKDRGAILPAGHSANAAYWYDDANESFITSSFYMTDLPLWVKSFNGRKLPDSLTAMGWQTLYPIESYIESTPDEEKYEGAYSGTGMATHFPYKFAHGPEAWSQIRTSPAGNTLTALFAKAAVLNEQLGKDAATDFLAVSFSSPDYIGHQFGPNSVENEDDYLRLDAELAQFFNFLDNQVGRGAYTVFLTADHAAAQVPGFLAEHHISTGNFSGATLTKNMNQALKTTYGYDSIIYGIVNYQVHLNHPFIKKYNLYDDSLRQWVVDYVRHQPMITHAFDLQKTMQEPMNEKLKMMVSNGYSYGRSGDVQFILKPGIIDHGSTGTTHGSWNPYDSHIPFLMMGWGIKHGSTRRETYMTDIAATISALLHIQMPNGCVGKVVEDALK